MSHQEPVNHFYAASILAYGYSTKVLEKSRNSSVRTINTANLIQHIKQLNISIKLSDLDVENIVNSIFADNKLKNKIVPNSKCSDIFKTPLLKESEDVKKNVQEIEEKFLNFVKSGVRLNKDNKNDHLYGGAIYDYIKLSYSRCPLINKDYKIDFMDIYNNFEKIFPYNKFMFEINLNLDYFVLPDLAPTILINGNGLAMQNKFGLRRIYIKKFNKYPFFLFPFSPTRAFILYYGIKENRNIIDKILKHHHFIHHIFGISLMTSFKKIVFIGKNEKFILGNMVRMISDNLSEIIRYRKEKGYLKFIPHLHQDKIVI